MGSLQHVPHSLLKLTPVVVHVTQRMLCPWVVFSQRQPCARCLFGLCHTACLQQGKCQAAMEEWGARICPLYLENMPKPLSQEKGQQAERPIALCIEPEWKEHSYEV